MENYSKLSLLPFLIWSTDHHIAGDALSNNSGSPFSSSDRDLTFKNCASQLKGAWWFLDCHDFHLNSQYQETNQSSFHWDQFSLRRSEMKIRRI